MKSLKDIREGFFANIGTLSKTEKNIIEMLDYYKKIRDNIANNKSKVSNDVKDSFFVNDLMDELENYHVSRTVLSADDDVFYKTVSDWPEEWSKNPKKKNIEIRSLYDINYHYYVIGPSSYEPLRCPIIICPETIGDVDKLPEWLVYHNISHRDEYNVYIYNMSKLSDLSKLFSSKDQSSEVDNLYIYNCPKLEGLPKVGKLKYIEGTLYYKPVLGKQYSLLDVSSLIPCQPNKIIFDRKVMSFDDNVKKPITKANNIPSATTTTTTVNNRLSLKAASDPNNLPTYKVNAKNRVFTDTGMEVGRITRDRTAVYRQVNKVLFIKFPDMNAVKKGDEIGVAYNKKDQPVCKLVID